MTDNSVAALVPIPTDDPRLARHRKALETFFGRDFANTFASPYMVMEQQLIASPVTERFLRKDFAYLSKQLYVEYQFRAWKGFNQDLLTRYSEITSTKLAHIRTLMQNSITRLRTLLEQQGHSMNGLSLWPNVQKRDIPVIAAMARRYVEVLQMMDHVYTLSGTANLMGVIDTQQRAEVEKQCKHAVRAFRSILQNEVTKLYREAQRLMAEQRGQGQVDKKMSEIVSQQGEDIAEFDKDTQQLDAEDTTMSLGGADPSQVIDDAAAASSAAMAAAGGARKRKKAAEPSAADAAGSSDAGAGIPAASAVAEPAVSATAGS